MLNGRERTQFMFELGLISQFPFQVTGKGSKLNYL